MGSIRYKIDVLQALKDRGYSTYKMRQERILAESVLQQIRRGELVTQEKLATLCSLLHCQPGDLLEYVEDSPEDAQDSQGGTSPTT